MICRNKIKWSRQTRSSALLDQEVWSFIAMFSNRLRKDIFGMCYSKRRYRKMLKDSVCSPVWFDSGIWRKRNYALVKNSTVQKIRKTDFTDTTLLIIDEWLLQPTTEAFCNCLLEIFERRKGLSTVKCTLYEQSEWHNTLGENVQAESVIDTIVHNCVDIVLGDLNMRAYTSPTKMK